MAHPPVIPVYFAASVIPGNGHEDHAPMFHARLYEQKLGQIWTARWVHPHRRIYIHAFVDACICWLLCTFILVGAVAVWHLPGPEQSLEIFDREPEGIWLLKTHEVMTGTIATITGINLGGILITLGRSRLEQMEEYGINIKKYISFGRWQISFWIYVGLAVIITIGLSFLSNGIANNMMWTRFWYYGAGSKIGQIVVSVPWTDAMFAVCTINLVAVTTGAIMRHRLLARGEKETQDDIESTTEKGLFSKTT
ncbi:hypothetical protein BJ170DRAFT_686307 [Xylariales sp. AK1849]|nr:hypothetical protein BJ170DRAFT_686307 [Xylariales sp. AK1849]